MEKVIELFREGGMIMWPLLVCSLLSLTISAERLVFWAARSRRRAGAQAELRHAAALAREGQPEEAAELLGRLDDPAAAVLAAGLSPVSPSTAMERRALPEMHACRRGLKLLDTIITIAPMLGLLGTVAGVIRSFGFVGGGAQLGQLDVKGIGGGIAEALITTAFGLAIAILSVIPYNYFSTRVQREAEELSSLASEMEEALWNEDRIRT